MRGGSCKKVTIQVSGTTGEFRQPAYEERNNKKVTGDRMAFCDEHDAALAQP